MRASPGMSALVEIKTGQKTVLEYLLRPVQALTQALRER
jgi:adhesin transport system membrane fusion protein